MTLCIFPSQKYTYLCNYPKKISHKSAFFQKVVQRMSMRNRLRGAPEAAQRHFIYNFSMSCRERFQKAYGKGLKRQYAAYQKLNRDISSPINFSHISLVSGLPFSPYPLTGFSTDITHPIREDSCGRLNPK